MLKALRGTKDILPEDVNMWRKIEDSARNIFSVYGYKEIRTPIIEEASLFVRSIGDGTDIVQKEMYVFSDKGGRIIALRPEATASIVRAYLENSLGQKERFTKLFYIGPMFRSERPQKGRQRQFHQLGVEAIGSDNPFLDAEVTSLAVNFLKRLGVKNFSLKINSLGCQKDKSKIIKKCRKSIEPHLDSLCGECKERYNKNVLRVFDCKNTSCSEVVKDIDFENLMCEDCNNHFESVKKSLEKLGVGYIVDPRMVRGLDYYTRTVFEIAQEDLGTKDAVCAGGRYDNLIEDMGGVDTSAIGFAFGIERLILALRGNVSQSNPSLDVFIATAGKDLYEDAFILMNSLRGKGVSCDIDYENRSLKSQLRKAEKLEARFVIIFGQEEFRQHKVVLRDMASRSQKEVRLGDIAQEISLHFVCVTKV